MSTNIYEIFTKFLVSHCFIQEIILDITSNSDRRRRPYIRHGRSSQLLFFWFAGIKHFFILTIEITIYLSFIGLVYLPATYYTNNISDLANHIKLNKNKNVFNCNNSLYYYTNILFCAAKCQNTPLHYNRI